MNTENKFLHQSRQYVYDCQKNHLTTMAATVTGIALMVSLVTVGLLRIPIYYAAIPTIAVAIIALMYFKKRLFIEEEMLQQQLKYLLDLKNVYDLTRKGPKDVHMNNPEHFQLMRAMIEVLNKQKLAQAA